MKKILSILMLVVYFIPAVGIDINMHYCNGKLIDIAINQKTENCSCGIDVEEGCCSKKQKAPKLKKECCEFDSQLMKIQDFQSYQNISFKNLLQLNAVVFTVFSSVIEEGIELRYTDGIVEYPPPIKEPLWLLHYSFIFYG